MKQILLSGQEALVTEGEVHRDQELKVHQESFDLAGEFVVHPPDNWSGPLPVPTHTFHGITCLAGTTVETHWACCVPFDTIQPF